MLKNELPVIDVDVSVQSFIFVLIRSKQYEWRRYCITEECECIHDRDGIIKIHDSHVGCIAYRLSLMPLQSDGLSASENKFKIPGLLVHTMH